MLSRFLIIVGFTIAVVRAEDFQPKALITVEVATKVLGSISSSHGTPWCNGKPTYWLIGHHNVKETPYCLVSDASDFDGFNYTDSQWARNSLAYLERQDELNEVDGPEAGIDRHDCTTMDVNYDGLPDILCGVGADKGTGNGYNEVYVTEPNGSLTKALQGHGLHKYTTMRNRLMVSLKSVNGSSLVLLATQGARRVDGNANNHRMFRLTNSTDAGAMHSFYFDEVTGPWNAYTNAICLRVIDINSDGFDDILMCNAGIPAWIFLQNATGSWRTLALKGSQRAYDWSNARIADLTGDGVDDLVVVGSYNQTHYIRVFAGTGQEPFFDFTNETGMIYERSLPHKPWDLEILDVNTDGTADIYVVQVDETQGYCSRPFNLQDWKQPGMSFPPIDTAPDLLLVGNPHNAGKEFTEVVMAHAKPGCGYIVDTFGNNRTMILAQGNMGRWGDNLLLQW